ncbi:MAG: hypothetical protein R3E12_09355 [Candidatus Eisenbacteria bacterium]
MVDGDHRVKVLDFGIAKAVRGEEAWNSQEARAGQDPRTGQDLRTGKGARTGKDARAGHDARTDRGVSVGEGGERVDVGSRGAHPVQPDLAATAPVRSRVAGTPAYMSRSSSWGSHPATRATCGPLGVFSMSAWSATPVSRRALVRSDRRSDPGQAALWRTFPHPLRKHWVP